jgi:hypothetical protein
MWAGWRRKSDSIKTPALARLYKHKMPKMPANKGAFKFLTVITRRFEMTASGSNYSVRSTTTLATQSGRSCVKPNDSFAPFTPFNIYAI